MNLPSELKYSQSHEWVRPEPDGALTIGITDHAQELMGDLVFVELPEPGTRFEARAECAVVESVKAASDVYCPVSGEISAVNEALADAPELVNESAFDKGWLFRVKPADSSALDGLMDAAAYAALVEAEQD